MGRESRGIWTKRVERWRDSGQSLKEFASELGVNVSTLAGWHYRLRAEERPGTTAERAGASRVRPAAASDGPTTVEFVEVKRTPPAEQPFELVAASGWTVRVPTQFDDDVLRRLLALVERA